MSPGPGRRGCRRGPRSVPFEAARPRRTRASRSSRCRSRPRRPCAIGGRRHGGTEAPGVPGRRRRPGPEAPSRVRVRKDRAVSLSPRPAGLAIRRPLAGGGSEPPRTGRAAPPPARRPRAAGPRVRGPVRRPGRGPTLADPPAPRGTSATGPTIPSVHRTVRRPGETGGCSRSRRDRSFAGPRRRGGGSLSRGWGGLRARRTRRSRRPSELPGEGRRTGAGFPGALRPRRRSNIAPSGVAGTRKGEGVPACRSMRRPSPVGANAIRLATRSRNSAAQALPAVRNW